MSAVCGARRVTEGVDAKLKLLLHVPRAPSTLANRYAPESSPRDEHAESHDHDMQRDHVGFAAHDVERDRQPHDDCQPDGGKRRQARRNPRGGGQYETDTRRQFRKANESDQCDRQVRSPRRRLNHVAQRAQPVIPSSGEREQAQKYLDDPKRDIHWLPPFDNTVPTTSRNNFGARPDSRSMSLVRMSK